MEVGTNPAPYPYLAAGASARPIGTLSQKIQCHENPSTTAPPTTGPSATPNPETPDQMPNLASELSKRGYAAEDVSKLLGGNWMRLFGQVWRSED